MAPSVKIPWPTRTITPVTMYNPFLSSGTIRFFPRETTHMEMAAHISHHNIAMSLVDAFSPSLRRQSPWNEQAEYPNTKVRNPKQNTIDITCGINNGTTVEHTLWLVIDTQKWLNKVCSANGVWFKFLGQFSEYKITQYYSIHFDLFGSSLVSDLIPSSPLKKKK